MKINIVTHPAGEISEHPFKTAFIDAPTDLMIALATWNAFGLSFWADAIGVDFDVRTPDEVIENFFEKLFEIDHTKVTIPTNVEEARGMALVGMKYLEQHAPHLINAKVTNENQV